MAKIRSIVLQPVEKEYEDGRFDYFIRDAVDSADLVANHGIQGDRKAGKNPRRQLNLLSVDWLNEQAKLGYKTAPGEFGEQLIVEGLDLLALPRGTTLQLGNTAVIQINGPRDGCTRLEAAQGKTGLAGEPIGVLATVLAGGKIQIGDLVIELVNAR